MNKTMYLVLIMIFVSIVACSSDDDLSGIEQQFNVSGDTNTLSIDEEEPVIDDDNVDVGESFEGPSPETPEVASDIESDDDDGDGIPDDEDHLPNVCTSMVVTANGVSSARIELNDEELYSPNDFRNQDAEYSSNVNLEDGDNTIFIRLAGSPGDQLNVRFYNCSKDPVELLYDTTVTRTTGSPNTN